MVGHVANHVCCLQTDTPESLISKQDALDAPSSAATASAPASAATGFASRQKLQQYHRMTERELQDLLIANGL